jgi:hypothetical protein
MNNDYLFAQTNEYLWLLKDAKEIVDEISGFGTVLPDEQ